MYPKSPKKVGEINASFEKYRTVGAECRIGRCSSTVNESR